MKEKTVIAHCEPWERRQLLRAPGGLSGLNFFKKAELRSRYCTGASHAHCTWGSSLPWTASCLELPTCTGSCHLSGPDKAAPTYFYQQDWGFSCPIGAAQLYAHRHLHRPIRAAPMWPIRAVPFGPIQLQGESSFAWGWTNEDRGRDFCLYVSFGSESALSFSTEDSVSWAELTHWQCLAGAEQSGSA